MSCAYCKKQKARFGCGHGCKSVGYCSQACANCDYSRHTCGGGFLVSKDNENVSDPKRPLFSVAGKMDAYAIALQPGASLGGERHRGVVQFFHVIAGSGTATIGSETRAIGPRDMFYVPPDTFHTVTASLKDDDGAPALQMITVYSDTDHRAYQ